MAPKQALAQRPGGNLNTASAALSAHLASQLRLQGAPKPAAGLSLAQRLNLVPGPPPPLTPSDWLKVRLASQARQDSAGDCAICLRPFKTEGQVLLSCSHTFHAACLAALERFSRQQGAACCPLCRAAAYEKRRIDDAERLWRHACAARIQAAWRGLQARRAYRALRRLLPPSHPALRRRWAAEALGEASTALEHSVAGATADVDALFAELDASVAAAGAVFDQLASRCPVAAVSSAQAGSGAAASSAGQAATGGDSSYAAAAGAAREGRSVVAANSRTGSSPSPAQQQQVDWEAVIARALERDEQPECAICLAPLGQLCTPRSPAGSVPKRTARQAAGSSSGASARRPGGMAVCSCSHAFHADCLSAVEAFAVSSDLAPACPCCRSAYTRLDLC